MKYLFTLLALFSLYTTASAQFPVIMKPEKAKTQAEIDSLRRLKSIKNLNAADFEKKIKTNTQLIDVRKADEFKEKHIPYAQNFDFEGPDFTQLTSGLNKSKPVYLYCKTGRRSAKAANTLDSLGFKKIFVLADGISKYSGKTIDNTNQKP